MGVLPQHVAETKNMADGMHRQLRHFFALLLYGLLNHQRFALFMQITALGGDVERVLEFAHGGFLLVLTAL